MARNEYAGLYPPAARSFHAKLRCANKSSPLPQNTKVLQQPSSIMSNGRKDMGNDGRARIWAFSDVWKVHKSYREAIRETQNEFPSSLTWGYQNARNEYAGVVSTPARSLHAKLRCANKSHPLPRIQRCAATEFHHEQWAMDMGNDGRARIWAFSDVWKVHKVIGEAIRGN
ncbi:hypothetical protein CEXT_221291 [Caerostris extrusa]|uniref:Uncharacterized protein n=1 Tax=Caerostris extrusa TaxID=172846 RepID=A0AAV4W2M5_CAEEX|nr:hypothetical protein CEXT_221291 [Caerostris extrusa]